jgi:hypothetical protein
LFRPTEFQDKNGERAATIDIFELEQVCLLPKKFFGKKTCEESADLHPNTYKGIYFTVTVLVSWKKSRPFLQHASSSVAPMISMAATPPRYVKMEQVKFF